MHGITNIFIKEKTISSLEVANMVGKNHKDLMRDIRRYCEQITESNLAPSESELTKLKIQPSDFFRENTYKDSNGRTLPCYDITKKGCEFIAHKLTGIKGTTILLCRHIYGVVLRCE